MASMGIDADVKVQYRNRFGQFASLLGAAGVGCARDLVETCARFAHENAPVGPPRSDYGRREKLSGSIEGRMTGAKVGVVHAKAGHAGPQEEGAGPHPIPNAFGKGITVMHPGNPAQPYLRPALEQLRAVSRAIVEKWYP